MILLYNNKKIILLLASIFMIFSVLTGCSSNKDKDKQGDDPVVTDSDISRKDQSAEQGGNEGGKDNITGDNGETNGKSPGGEEDSIGVAPKTTEEDKRLVKDVNIESIPVPNEPSTSNYIYLKVDKNQGEVGDVIKAEISINLAANFAGYQLNLKYDPEVLQAVNYETHEPFDKGTRPPGATILTNQEYLPMNLVDNDIADGVLNFGTTYTNYPDYKASGVAEKSGVLAVIGFKILKKETTVIGFENGEAMPTGKQGTMLFNWDGNRLSSYEVVGVQKIN